ncbi:MAG: DUF234 domain-containing protein [Muribaculaceae bacterium]
MAVKIFLSILANRNSGFGNYGFYLTRLEDDYGIISKEIPAGAKTLSKNAVYVIRDNFFTFWFRFIYKYSHIIEIGGYEQLRLLIKRDYPTFSGLMLERYSRACAVESKRFTLIGRWWDRKGENDIDMIAANELEKCVDVCEIKRNRKNISHAVLEDKTRVMLTAINMFVDYKVELKGLDIDDM